jgi:hypothetical protein
MKKVAAITIMLCMFGASVAFAVDPTPDAVVTGAESVTITDLVVSDFDTVLLDGTTKTTTSTVTDMTLVDARGLGDGWSVNMTATQFTNATAANITLNKLPLSSLELGLVSIVAGVDSTPITNITIGSGEIDKVGGVKILDAGINEGMGTYTASIAPTTLTLLPKDAKAGTYTSTITMTLSQGPVA